MEGTAYSSEHFPLYWIMSGNFFVVEFSCNLVPFIYVSWVFLLVQVIAVSTEKLTLYRFQSTDKLFFWLVSLISATRAGPGWNSSNAGIVLVIRASFNKAF